MESISDLEKFNQQRIRRLAAIGCLLASLGAQPQALLVSGAEANYQKNISHPSENKISGRLGKLLKLLKFMNIGVTDKVTADDIVMFLRQSVVFRNV